MRLLFDEEYIKQLCKKEAHNLPLMQEAKTDHYPTGGTCYKSFYSKIIKKDDGTIYCEVEV